MGKKKGAKTKAVEQHAAKAADSTAASVDAPPAVVGPSQAGDQHVAASVDRVAEAKGHDSREAVSARADPAQDDAHAPVVAIATRHEVDLCPDGTAAPPAAVALGHEGRGFERVERVDSHDSFRTEDDSEREDDIGARVWAGVEDVDSLGSEKSGASARVAAAWEADDSPEEQKFLLTALGEVPPEFAVPVHAPMWQGDQAFTDLEDVADMDPSFSHEDTTSDDEEGGDEECAAEGHSEVEQTPTSSLSDAHTVNGGKAADDADSPHSKDSGKQHESESAGHHDSALTASQRASVSELFEKKAPERQLDASRALPVTFLVVDHEDMPLYQPCEDASWWPHRAKIEEQNKRPGVKALIVRTETRGPKSAMYTMYVIHVKTAFHVRGVSRRFSDFSRLDSKLRGQFPGAPELARSNRILGTLSPGFVQERRQHLQEYLDKLLGDHQLAHSDTVRQFLAISNVPDMPSAHEAKLLHDPFAETAWHVDTVNLAALLQELQQCRSATDAPRETRLLNAIGLVLCELGNQAEGLLYLHKAVANARLSHDRRALLACISNHACAHFRFGGHAPAVELLEEAVELAQRLADPSLEAACLRKIALVHASACAMPAGLRYIVQAAELCAAEEDKAGAASALFTSGVIKYEMGDTVGGVQAWEEALMLRRHVKDKLGIAETLNRLGLALIDIGYHLQALDYFERALSLCQEMGDGWGEAATLRLLGFVHLAQVFLYWRETSAHRVHLAQVDTVC